MKGAKAHRSLKEELGRGPAVHLIVQRLDAFGGAFEQRPVDGRQLKPLGH
jgi:hypothetical protein